MSYVKHVPEIWNAFGGELNENFITDIVTEMCIIF